VALWGSSMRGAIGLLACVLVCVAVPAQAELQNCTITWTPNSEADLFGYKLYVAPTPRGYVKGSPGVTIGKGATTARCSQLGLTVPQTYYFAVTAYDTSGNESDFSNEVSKLIAEVVVVPLAYVTRVLTDTDGATVTISGPAAKLYVYGGAIEFQEVAGYTAGSATHRHTKRWEASDSFVCFVAENIEGTRTEQQCNTVVVGEDRDVVAPSAPTGVTVQ